MADPAAGYDGILTETALPQWASGLGHPAHEKEYGHFNILKVDGGSITLAGGVAYGYGVSEPVDESVVTYGQDGQPALPTSGTRWDTLCFVKNFVATANGSIPGGKGRWVIYPGGTDKTLVGGPYRPGEEMASAKWMLQVGPSGVVARERVQVFAGSNLWSESRLGLPGDSGVGTVVRIGGREWVKAPDPASGVVDWRLKNHAVPGQATLTDQMVTSSQAITVPSPTGGPFTVDLTATAWVLASAGGWVSFRSNGSGGTPDYHLGGSSDHYNMMKVTDYAVSLDGAPVVFQVSLKFSESLTTGGSTAVGFASGGRFVPTQSLSVARWLARSI